MDCPAPLSHSLVPGLQRLIAHAHQLDAHKSTRRTALCPCRGTDITPASSQLQCPTACTAAAPAVGAPPSGLGPDRPYRRSHRSFSTTWQPSHACKRRWLEPLATQRHAEPGWVVAWYGLLVGPSAVRPASGPHWRRQQRGASGGDALGQAPYLQAASSCTPGVGSMRWHRSPAERRTGLLEQLAAQVPPPHVPAACTTSWCQQHTVPRLPFLQA